MSQLQQSLHERKNHKTLMDQKKKGGRISPTIQPDNNPLSLDNSMARDTTFILNLAKVEETESQKFKAGIAEDVNQLLSIIGKANEQQPVDNAYEMLD